MKRGRKTIDFNGVTGNRNPIKEEEEKNKMQIIVIFLSARAGDQ
jgi:hypothetical protein